MDPIQFIWKICKYCAVWLNCLLKVFFFSSTFRRDCMISNIFRACPSDYLLLIKFLRKLDFFLVIALVLFFATKFWRKDSIGKTVFFKYSRLCQLRKGLTSMALKIPPKGLWKILWTEDFNFTDPSEVPSSPTSISKVVLYPCHVWTQLKFST